MSALDEAAPAPAPAEQYKAQGTNDVNALLAADAGDEFAPRVKDGTRRRRGS